MKHLAKPACHARFFKLALLVLGVITGFGATANAAAPSEGFPTLRVDVGILAPRGLGMKTWGYGGSVEPKLMLTNAAAVGLRLEGAFHTGGSVSDGKADVSTFPTPKGCA